MTAFSTKTLMSQKTARSNITKFGGRGTGPLKPHMEPRNFEKMVVRQKNSSRYFRPRVKLRTEALHKVLYKLKKEKQDLDQSLERLEMVSNFGETHLKVDFSHTNIIRDLNIKANPRQHNSPNKRRKRKEMRKVKSAVQRPSTAMSRLLGNSQAGRRKSSRAKKEETTAARMKKFYQTMNERYQMHKMTRRRKRESEARFELFERREEEPHPAEAVG